MIQRKCNTWAVVLVSGCLLLAGGTVQARGWSWAKRLPISQYTEEDTAIFHKSLDAALETSEDGESLDWENPNTGVSGRITPLSREQIDGNTCRKTRFESQAGTTKNVSEFVLCRQPDGVWSVGGDTAQ